MVWDSTKRFDSDGENVSKFVFTNPSAVAEAVLYRYPTYLQRTVICCSTMSGCPMGCKFCGSGNAFIRNLSVDEIISQPVHLLKETGVDLAQIEKLQIMFMSMGEPLLNCDALCGAIEKLHELYPNAQLLVSTSAPRAGKAFKQFTELSKRIPTVGLQFSVHESTNEARANLIYAPTLSLENIAVVGENWHFETGRYPFFNYCAHEGNSSDADVERLTKLFDPNIWRCTLSVICEKDESVKSSMERQLDLITGFSSKMLQNGFDVRVFNPAGQDSIGGGCGQLWFVQKWMKDHPELAKATRR